MAAEHQIRAAKLYDVDTIVRVARGSYSDYVRAYEADATALMGKEISFTGCVALTKFSQASDAEIIPVQLSEVG